ncbi:MAG: FtsB family cell division protein [Candidatus Bipolaricaulota bacterium]
MATGDKEQAGLAGPLQGRAVTILLVIALLASGFLGWVYWRRFERIFTLRAELSELKEERAELREQISKLEDEVARRNDPGYIEKLAREELGLVYPPDEERGSD